MTIFDRLRDTDHQLLSHLDNLELNTEEIHALVDIREHIIKTLIAACERNPRLKQSEEWRLAVEETKQVTAKMHSKTEQLGLSLRKFRHGKKSLQQYQKFI
ncbi:flagellar protein FliT [Vibrio sp. ZSDZ65]|uniref:Flagellar protein FliT n=1 Tax=Vibrio qingdaonensis TaxID=2829491 RepID=A0A9X3HXU2_9VIBR|nr:flagellar protein FliT [Vibrio qingdaonensis]MCW8347659.1 flagellar protein FliT [Vibrio qingdaonensis]